MPCVTFAAPRRSAVACACACAAASLLAARPARAVSTLDDPYDLPEAPRPITLPELTHPDVEWTGVSSLGSVHTTDSTGAHHASPMFTQRLALEVPIASRRWFAGAAYELAGGPPIEAPGPSRLVGGNPEIYGRTVWATRTGLAFGGGLGILPSIATFTRDGTAGDVARAAATLQPADYSYFHQGVFTVRTFVDVRDLVGPWVIQFRQSFDWTFETSDPSDTSVSATSSLYLGLLLMHEIGAGIEASEYYQLDSSVPDDRRAHFLIAPSVRLMTPNVQPALSAFTSIGHPLYSDGDMVWGLRFAITVVWDPRRHELAEAAESQTSTR